MIRYVVLGLLRGGTAHHGYALMKEYRGRSGSHVVGGRFYREIRRLAREGLVRPTTNSPGADPRRVPYEITPAGAAEFDSWLANVGVADAHLDDELCARAALLRDAPPVLVDGALRRWHEELWMRGARIEDEQQRALAEHGAEQAAAFDPRPLVLSHRVKRAAGDVEFLEELLAAYKKWVARASVQRGRSKASSE